MIEKREREEQRRKGRRSGIERVKERGEREIERKRERKEDRVRKNEIDREPDNRESFFSIVSSERIQKDNSRELTAQKHFHKRLH